MTYGEEASIHCNCSERRILSIAVNVLLFSVEVYTDSLRWLKLMLG